MLFTFGAIAGLAGIALGLPHPWEEASGPIRILPHSWVFNITSLSGPGCPDFGDTAAVFSTRPTFGMNTVDGSEIYYWHFAYPNLRASVGPGAATSSIWCETTLTYAELDRLGTPPAKPEYRLKAHKNGTAMIATYDLEDGVVAEWKFTYYPAGKEPVVDTITVAGPVSPTSIRHNSPVTELAQWAMPDCGTGSIRYRTELTVTAKKDGARGAVSSDQVQYEGKSEFYGAQQGVSYDWEKCAA
ncbi:hypothetical protein QBC40DRAFT_269282 [Triangularia verruculosa]|uniref:Uncharacterized protein n=1 Tax=Triangularia verruculosa TaxID=2587418 RepID=A0AAN7AR49_9PEZI|nr:hypothetical protein QBC40DRAFT_269282 [Triangularia verruculosa]